MEVDWESYINFPEDIIPINFFSESVEGTELENIIPPNNFLEEPIEPPINSPIEPFIESLIEPLTEPQSPCTDNLNTTNYQYKLCVGDNFDDWLSVDTFMHKYCQERGFGYQIFRNDKDQNDRSISRRKSFRCSLSGTYEARKVIDQNLHRQRNSNKSNCTWHCNFTLPKSEHQIRCTTLVDVHNHELVSSMQIAHLNARYRQFNEDMMQDLKFFTDCKVAPIVQLEILKKKYPQHVFHRQDVYNSIYKLRESGKNDEKLDSGSLLNALFEKMIEDPRWKVFVRHSGSERRLSGIFWMSPLQQDLYQQFHDVVLSDNTCKTNKYNMYLSVFMIKDNYGKFRNIANALVEDEMASTYTWILQCIMKATDNVAPKSFWTDAEPGLINAVSHIFPNTPHFYCLFHIWQNIIKHLKTKLGSKFHSFSTYFYSCRNTLSTELFEKKWKSMLDTFPECYSYMMRALYPNRSSWAKSYLPFQFNAGIQSTQSVESFNALIKKSLNSASTLCDIEKAINRRHEDEFQYCKLVDLKAQQTTVGLPHLSSQFFSKIDAVLTQFLTPLILSWERFQISQSFTYEGCLTQSVIDDEASIILLNYLHGDIIIQFNNLISLYKLKILGSDTINDNFIEDIVDEPQVTLKSLLTDTQCSIIEMWRIRRIGGISRKENIVVLFTDGTHLCTCLETITKGIICRHFWRVMLYSSLAQFHIRIIPVRWYNNSVLTNLDINLENSPILTAVESSNTTLLPQVNFTLQSLQQFQRSDHNEIIINKNLPQRNRFGIAFSTAKTAVNIAIETNSDVELIRLLKEFIATKRGGDGDGDRNGDGDGDRNGNGDDNGNGNSNDNEIEINKDINDIVPLQEHLINNITNPNVTRIRGAPSKKRIKSAIESSKKRVAMQEISLNKDSNQLAPAKQRRRCLTCGKLGHYQKRCPSNIN